MPRSRDWQTARRICPLRLINVDVRLGLIVLLGGMFAALFFCIRRWDQRPLYKYLPPAYGLIAGIVLAFE